ncbi:MAG: rRNA ((2251)-2-O)-methyltransferase RlmB, partial [Bacteriovoracaceae bacterium]|nr:rRNA ((2251)-2-O)-methyltransferase RlmB [Bacteriovoracaceae bacterium]
STALYKWEPYFPLALVVGSEGTGLSKPVRGQLEAMVHIPMNGGVESLNATQAATVAMSWVFEKMKK